jgi:Uma2 family endonuclease
MASRVTRKRFTADEYQRMGQVGILTEHDRVELIDGEIVAMTPVGARHNACVNYANRALVRLAGDDAIVQAQGSVRLDLHSEPEPDLVLLRPQPDFYTTSRRPCRHPAHHRDRRIVHRLRSRSEGATLREGRCP